MKILLFCFSNVNMAAQLSRKDSLGNVGVLIMHYHYWRD